MKTMEKAGYAAYVFWIIFMVFVFVGVLFSASRVPKDILCETCRKPIKGVSFITEADGEMHYFCSVDCIQKYSNYLP